MLRSVLRFDGRFLVNLPPASIPTGNEITISFWAYGGDYLPSNTSVICAKEPGGNRVVNIHLPWSNSRIYFDCGNYGSMYDRIDQEAQPSDYKNKWTHWAFTKNAATGEMNIYLNGNLWLIGQGKRYPLAGCQEVTLGTYLDGNNFYDYQGMVSEFQIWNRARTGAEIKATMSNPLVGNEPGLVGYWPLDEGSGNIVRDRTSNGYNGTIDSPDGLSAIGWVQSEIPLQPGGIGGLPKKPNILILLNDQDSAAVAKRNPQSFEDRLVATKRLKKNGLTFNKAFIASAACSPSRACLLTSTYPQENGVLNTIGAVQTDDRVNEAPIPSSFSQNSLRPTQLNLAHMLKAAGYKVYWKGKWHLGHPVSGTNTFTDADVKHMKEAYGFDGWNPSDAGITKINPQLFGKGLCLHDIRFLEGNKNACVQEADKAKACTQPLVEAQGILEFIENYDPKDGPFCLVVSLVNPHDIHCAPHFEPEALYDENEFKDLGLPIPDNVDEDLSTKPEIHEVRQQSNKVGDASVSARLKREADAKLAKANTVGLTQAEIDKLKSEAAELIKKSKRAVVGTGNPDIDKNDPQLRESRQLFVNFYGYLRLTVDLQMNQILEAFDRKGLTEDTLIVRTADHGEMCLAHGQREKNYFAYEEVMNVPFIFSNPKLFPTPRETDVLASSIDLLPTLASIVGIYDNFKFALRGSDLSPLFKDPEAKIYPSYDHTKEREYIHYASDDGFLPERFQYTPLYIRSVRTKKWKYSVYFNRFGNKFEYELYDLETDPLENNNLIGVARYWEQQKTLHNQLLEAMIKMGTVPSPYWIYTEEMQKTTFVPPQYWPTTPEAVLSGRMQYEANKAEQKFRRSALIQSLVGQVPANLWWIG